MKRKVQEKEKEREVQGTREGEGEGEGDSLIYTFFTLSRLTYPSCSSLLSFPRSPSHSPFLLHNFPIYTSPSLPLPLHCSESSSPTPFPTCSLPPLILPLESRRKEKCTIRNKKKREIHKGQEKEGEMRKENAAHRLRKQTSAHHIPVSRWHLLVPPPREDKKKLLLSPWNPLVGLLVCF